MILVDTSVWIAHFRGRDIGLTERLEEGIVLVHPFVIGELALGNLRQRDEILTALMDLPHATAASEEEALSFIDQHELWGLGIGYVDLHLLAAARLTVDARLWSLDKRLMAAAERLSLSAHVR